ncbi:DsbA family protein [Candidatus Peregrinibacteria bacterium]|jgi:protein-disulfide isomerase|nr:DsbA family protein [Candidatus Peregrinibacteria bacterium]
MAGKQNFNPWMMSTVVLIALIIGYVVGGMGGGGITFEGSGDTADAPEIALGELSGGEGPILGDSDAPVVLEEYSDYQCPYCKRHYTNTFMQLYNTYVKTGQVRLEFKDYPLSFHANAVPAAVAAYCAGEQKNYWGMHDALYENFDLWAKSTNPNVEFVRIAKALKLKTKNFEKCLSSGNYDAIIDANQAEGVKKGVTGTPAFFINGKKVVGAQPFSVFKSLIEEAMEPEAVEEEVEVELTE